MANERLKPGFGDVEVGSEEDDVNRAFQQIVYGFGNEIEVVPGNPVGDVEAPKPFDEVAAYSAAREFFVSYNRLVVSQRSASNAEETLIINTAEGPLEPLNSIGNPDDRSRSAQKSRLAVMDVMHSMKAHRGSVVGLIAAVKEMPKDAKKEFFDALEKQIKLLEVNQIQIDKHAVEWRRVNKANKNENDPAKKEKMPGLISEYEGLTAGEAKQARELLSAIKDGRLVERDDAKTIPGVEALAVNMSDAPSAEGKSFEAVSQFMGTDKWKEWNDQVAATREQRIAFVATRIPRAAFDGFIII